MRLCKGERGNRKVKNENNIGKQIKLKETNKHAIFILTLQTLKK